MEIGEIIKDALAYPTRNWEIFVMIGLLVVVGNISQLARPLLSGFDEISILSFILSIIALIATFILLGYLLSITRATINHSDDLPQLDFVKNFVDGIKILIVDLLYFIIPLIILTILAAVLGVFNMIGRLMPFITNYGTDALNHIPEDLLYSLGIGFIIISLVGLVLFIGTMLFVYIALARLAKYDSLESAFNVNEVLNDISKIGWGKYILFIIIIIITLFIFMLIQGIFGTFGVIGLLIGLFLIYTFSQMFFFRSLGLIYRKTQE